MVLPSEGASLHRFCVADSVWNLKGKLRCVVQFAFEWCCAEDKSWMLDEIVGHPEDICEIKTLLLSGLTRKDVQGDAVVGVMLE